MTITIRAKAAPGRYKGRRARRAAFAERQRIARHMSRVVNAISADKPNIIEAALRDALVLGIGVVGSAWDYGDGVGFVERPPECGEWPKAMLRTVRVTVDELFAPAFPKDAT